MSDKYSDGCLSFHYGNDVVYRTLHFLDFPKYRIGTNGTVCSYRLSERWQQRKLGISDKGYSTCQLRRGKNVYVNYLVHRLVLEAFTGKCPEGMQCRHLNGKKTNNAIENLCWGTPGQNTEDKFRHGVVRRKKPVKNSRGQNTLIQGEKNGHSTMTESQVREVRKLYATGNYSAEDLSRMFQVTGPNITAIVKWKTWKHVDTQES